MSAPMVLGAEAPHVMQWVLRTLTPTCRCPKRRLASGGTAACGHRPTTTVRPYRAPLFEALPNVAPCDLLAIAVSTVRSLGLSERILARVALALTALENYFRSIGAWWDARRMSDMRWPVDELLDEHRRRHEVDAVNRHASMWQSAFATAWVEVSRARLDRRAAAKTDGGDRG